MNCLNGASDIPEIEKQSKAVEVRLFKFWKDVSSFEANTSGPECEILALASTIPHCDGALFEIIMAVSLFFHIWETMLQPA